MRIFVVIGAIGVMFLAAGAFYVWDMPKESAPTTTETNKKVAEESEPNEATLTLSSKEVAQGEVLVVEAQGPVTKLRLGEKEIALAELETPTSSTAQQADRRKIAVIGFDTRAKVGLRTLRFETPSGTKTKEFRVVERTYPVTRIVVPEKLAKEGVTSGDLAESISESDNVTLADIVKAETAQYHIKDQFVEPTDEWVNVGGFGNVRKDQYGSIRHLGVDLKGKTGDPVYAAGRGVIVFAGELQNYGKSVVIDHGVGIFSIYLHLSAIEKGPNTPVAAGERIARIGNTGAYTLEPHLHFSIKVHGVSVDPRAFIDTFNETL